MRVLHVISGGDTGGGKTHVLTLVSELRKSIPVSIMCFMEGPFSREARDLGLDIQVATQRGRYDLSVVRALVRSVRELGTSIVHAHGARANFVTVLAKPGLGVPLVTTVHSDYRRDFAHSLYKHLVFTSLNTLALRFFDHYIVVSAPVGELLHGQGIAQNRIHQVRNYLARVESPGDRQEFLRSYRLDRLAGNLRIGALGRLHGVKGQDVLVRAAELVCGCFPDVHFLLGGDGPSRASLEAQVAGLGLEERVHFLGHIARPVDFLHALDIHVLPSRSETFPYVVLEAATLGLPTVATDVGSVSELIRHDHTGLLVPADDAQALASAIAELVSDPGRAKRLGDNLRLTAQPFFSPGDMARRHLDIYQGILEAAGTKAPTTLV